MDARKLEALRRDYEGEVPVAEVIAASGLSRRAFYEMVRAQSWTMRQRPRRRSTGVEETPQTLLARLYRTFAKQVAEAEARAGRGDVAEAERDAKVLSVLAKTFETLWALAGTKQQGGEAANEAVTDLDQLQREIAQRLARMGGAR